MSAADGLAQLADVGAQVLLARLVGSSQTVAAALRTRLRGRLPGPKRAPADGAGTLVKSHAPAAPSIIMNMKNTIFRAISTVAMMPRIIPA